MRAFLRRNRGVLLLGTVFGLLLLALALLTVAGGTGTLDPDGYDPGGGHALAALLRQQGVEVVRTTDLPSTQAVAGEDTTVFVPLPDLLSHEELGALGRLPGTLVVAGATQGQVDALGVGTAVRGEVTPHDEDPGCALDIAQNAGRALAGGVRYHGSVSCYAGSLVPMPHQPGVLVGAADGLENTHLGAQGNAALWIGLLGRHRRLAWLMPSASRQALGVPPATSIDDVLPHWVHFVRWQLLITGCLLVAWRVRRLGPVVLERLPAVVRASETTEGHGRLYRAAGSRDAAAGALRATARRALGRLVHDRGRSPEVLHDLVAARTGRDPAAVRALLSGPAPADDAALVRLAADLDTLTAQALTGQDPTTHAHTDEGAGP